MYNKKDNSKKKRKMAEIPTRIQQLVEKRNRN